MGQTDLIGIPVDSESNPSWINPNELIAVFDDTVYFNHKGWIEIVLNKSFHHDIQKSLVISFTDESPYYKRDNSIRFL